MEENAEFGKLLLRFSYGTAEKMEMRSYLHVHVLAYWEDTKRLHCIQECCIVHKPGNHSLLAHPGSEPLR